jgi:5-formyltetrahydrofolate cyclo-ligase
MAVTETDPAELALRHRAKDELRLRLRAVRKALPREAQERRSRAICERVLALPAFEQARTVLGYVAMAGEADPRLLLERAWQDGKIVALPRIAGSSPGMTLHRVERTDAMEQSNFHFEQPPQSAPLIEPAKVDLVLVPALAADERGYRIGWGKGYYDRLLPNMPQATSATLIYDFQLLAEVPDTPGDVPTHYVVTGTGIIGLSS